MKRIVFALIVCFGISLFAQDQQEENLVFQNFVLENLEGDLVELEEELGEGPILLSFWATWCKPCKEELKEYNKLYSKYEEKGLTLFAISVDNEKSISKVKPFVKTNGYEFPVLLDPNSEAARLYYAQMVPYSLILNKTGEVVYSHLGFKRGDELKVEKIIADLL